MKDRVAAKPNRYAVYDDNHNFLRYEYHERADEPTQEGTPLSKANLLSDTTAAKYFTSATGAETVNQVLSKLAAAALKDGTAIKDALGNLITLPSVQLDSRVQIAAGSYVGTGTYGSANPCSLTFPFSPKLVILYTNKGIQLYGQYKGYFYQSFIWTVRTTELKFEFSSGDNNTYFSAVGNTLTWYQQYTERGSQTNDAGVTYYYLAIS